MSTNFKQTVLLVDDEESILKSLKRLLKVLEIEIITAPNGQEALNFLDQYNVSLIISDQRMPVMTGVEFLQKSQNVVPDAIRILLTGYADLEVTMTAINSGAIRYYFTKPWDDEFLLSRVKESLDLYRMTVDNRRLGNLLKKQNEQLKKLNKTLEYRVTEQTKEIKDQHNELNQSFMGTIKSFSTIIDLRYKDVGSHSQRVASLASKMCKAMNISSNKEYQDIVIAAYLHDIGKIGLADKILQKSQRDLNKTETEEYKNHPILGQSCIYGIVGFEEICVIIRHHHEHYNGSGYPDNIREKRIPLGARIIRVADAFDKYAFEKGYPNEKILKEAAAHLVEYSGTIFDPEIVKKFIEHDLAQNFIYPESSETITVRPFELEVGMILAADIHTKSGMFLLPKGAKLSSGMIKRIIKIDSLDSIHAGVTVNKHSIQYEGKNVSVQGIIG
jgi:response regulator RpfG family c-di-GMP phosphodiesterase